MTPRTQAGRRLAGILEDVLIGEDSHEPLLDILAIEDQAQSMRWPAVPEALDVERLAAVFAAHHGPSYFPGLFDVTVFGKTPREVAETIAREYAALSSKEPTE